MQLRAERSDGRDQYEVEEQLEPARLAFLHDVFAAHGSPL
jgi:hypothetical protein